MDEKLFSISEAVPEDLITEELTLHWYDPDKDTYKITYNGISIGLISIVSPGLYAGYYIEQMEIYNQYKNQGYGTAFIDALMDEDKSLDFYVLPHDNKALNFWEKLGFVKEYDGIGDYVWHYIKIKTIIISTLQF